MYLPPGHTINLINAAVVRATRSGIRPQVIWERRLKDDVSPDERKVLQPLINDIEAEHNLSTIFKKRGKKPSVVMNSVFEGMNIVSGAYAGYVGATVALMSSSLLAVIMATVVGGLTFPIFLYLLKKVVRNIIERFTRIRRRRKALNTVSGGYKQTRKTKRRISRRNKKTKRHKRR